MKLATKLRDYVESAKLVEFSTLNSLSLTSENSLRVTLSNLVRKDEIYNPVRGVYVAKSADPFWVATTLYPGYISLSSAFYLHHLIDEYPFTVFIASGKRMSLQMGGHEFLYFKAKNYLEVEKETYPVASVEKAIYDSLNHADLVSYPRLTKVLYDASICAERFLRICKNEKSAFFQRLGYLLSILPSRDTEKEKLMKFCRKKIKANVYLQGRKSGRYIQEWKLVDNIGKEVLLSWWRQ
jgi:predicted transcriptional regulator of viral defense system